MFKISNVKKTLVLIFIGIALILAGMSIISVVSATSTNKITKIEYLSPTQMYVDPGGTAEFGLKATIEATSDPAFYVTMDGSLYNWNKTAYMIESGWKLDLYYETHDVQREFLWSDRAQPALHRDHARAAAGGAGRRPEGDCDCGAQRPGGAALYCARGEVAQLIRKTR